MRIILLLLISSLSALELGVDVYFQEGHHVKHRGKRIGLVTNQTGVNKRSQPTWKLLQPFGLAALFTPEHGLSGSAYANDSIAHGKEGKLPIYSLHGKTKRPTKAMLENLDLIIYDIQDIGVRSYTYATTLFYVMEEAAKYGKEVIVLDRPNPMGGEVVDGASLDPNFRSFVGYINVPYVHGMTIGELAKYFNREYKIHCRLQVIPMKGWKRHQTYAQTPLSWIPTSPHIPEPDTPLFYATTGLIGELSLVNTGVGYTLPFKCIGAPWINADEYAAHLNKQKLPGVHFTPLHYRPFYALHKNKECHGVLIQITDPHIYEPLSTCYTLIGLLKSLYPNQVATAFKAMSTSRWKQVCNAFGSESLLTQIKNEKYIAWNLRTAGKKKRSAFKTRRLPYLLYP